MSSDFYNSFILPYSAIIIKICRAYTNTQEDFEDYYQEVCLQIWRSRERFREQSEWSTWVYRLSLNVCMTLLKKRKNHKELFASDYVPDEVIEDSRSFSDEELNELYRAIRQLSEVDRAVILLYLEERSYEEIAESTWKIPEEFRQSRYYCVGHGLGMSGEKPNIPYPVKGEKYPLDGEVEPGMVICIESYIGSECDNQGVKLEDQLYVKENSVERMSNFGFDYNLSSGTI